MTALPQEQRYTYEDLLNWDDGIRYELYDGQPVALASPSDVHQEISMELATQFHTYLKGKRCKVYAAPFDVRLFEASGDGPEEVEYVLQPDLTVVCDPEKVDPRGVHGAPDLVVEILSPSTAQFDKLWKFNLYQKAGVREYWIVDPKDRMVSVFTLADGKYCAAAYGADASVPVSVLEGCVIEMSAVFPEPETQEPEAE